MSGISSNLLSKLMGLFGKGIGVALLLFITIFQNNQHQNILIFFFHFLYRIIYKCEYKNIESYIRNVTNVND
jgi:hypothetical protein